MHRLKSETARHHHAAESLVDAYRNFRSPSAYSAHLRSTLRFFQPFEEAMSVINWQALTLDYSSRTKSQLLMSDLRYLQIPIPDREDVHFDIASCGPFFAIGCLYVVEGATLGGQVITRYLEQIGITPETGGSFFNGYGKRTGEMWKLFQTAATEACVTEEEQNLAVAGAVWTFEQYARFLAPSTQTSCPAHANAL